MKKSIIPFLYALLSIIVLLGCSSDPVVPEPEPGPEPGVDPDEVFLSVLPSVEGIKSRGVIEEFSSSDRIGLYVTTGSLGNPYEGNSDFNNISFTYDGSSWNMGKAVELTENNATVYGYYPYREDGLDNNTLPVEIISQTDYLYASSSVATQKKPDVSLTMKHGLSLVSFVIERNGYRHEGKLSKIIIDGIKETGELNIGTGEVVGSGADTYFELACDYIISESNKKHSVICLPVNIAETSGVTFKFMIDGYYYTYDVSSSHNWEQGYEYTYTLYLGDYYLPHIPDEDIELDVEYWSQFGKEDNITIGSPVSSQLRVTTNYQNYGKICYTGEGKKFGVFVYNYGDAFEGDIRLALYEGDRLVEQYPPYSITIAKSVYAGWRIPCFVNCDPGRYILRPLFREKGQEEWFVPQYAGGVDDEDWMYDVQPKTSLPALRNIGLVGYGHDDSLIRFVNLNEPFKMDYVICNKAGVDIKGEVKVIFERNTIDFGLTYDDHSIFYQDEIGRFDLDIPADKSYIEEQVECCITIRRPHVTYAGPTVHFYFKADGSEDWVLMRDNCDSNFEYLKGVDHMSRITVDGKEVWGCSEVVGQYLTTNYANLRVN